MAKVTITLEANGTTTKIVESRNRTVLFGQANDSPDLAQLFLIAASRAFGVLQPELAQFQKQKDAIIRLAEELGVTIKEKTHTTPIS